MWAVCFASENVWRNLGNQVVLRSGERIEVLSLEDFASIAKQRWKVLSNCMSALPVPETG